METMEGKTDHNTKNAYMKTFFKVHWFLEICRQLADIVIHISCSILAGNENDKITKYLPTQDIFWISFFNNVFFSLSLSLQLTLSLTRT